MGEPAFFYTALLFLDFSDGPEGAECEYSEQGWPECVSDPYGASYSYDSEHKEPPSAAWTEIVFTLYGDGMEYSYYKECA